MYFTCMLYFLASLLKNLLTPQMSVLVIVYWKSACKPECRFGFWFNKCVKHCTIRNTFIANTMLRNVFSGLIYASVSWEYQEWGSCFPSPIQLSSAFPASASQSHYPGVLATWAWWGLERWRAVIDATDLLEKKKLCCAGMLFSLNYIYSGSCSFHPCQLDTVSYSFSISLSLSLSFLELQDEISQFCFPCLWNSPRCQQFSKDFSSAVAKWISEWMHEYCYTQRKNRNYTKKKSILQHSLSLNLSPPSLSHL